MLQPQDGNPDLQCQAIYSPLQSKQKYEILYTVMEAIYADHTFII